MIVYLARDIPEFVMYCVNGESGSSLLIESTDSMIVLLYHHVYRAGVYTHTYTHIHTHVHTHMYTHTHTHTHTHTPARPHT